MVKTAPIERVMHTIMDRYNRKPQGWRVLSDGKGNVLVLGPDVGYQLKLVPLNPHEYTGVGINITRIDDMKDIATEFPSYGFRPLTERETKGLMNTFRHGETLPDDLITELFRIRPVSTLDLPLRNPTAVLGGPVLVHPDLSTISQHQRDLETKLTVAAEKLFRRKYPHRAALYR